MQILTSHPRPTASDTLGSGPGNPCFNKPPGNPDASWSLRILAEWKEPGMGARRPNSDSSSGSHGPVQGKLVNSQDAPLCASRLNARMWGYWDELDAVLILRWCLILYIPLFLQGRNCLVVVLVLFHIWIPSACSITGIQYICSGPSDKPFTTMVNITVPFINNAIPV